MSAKAQKMYQFLDGSASNSDPNESSGMVTALLANQEPVNVPRPEKEESGNAERIGYFNVHADKNLEDIIYDLPKFCLLYTSPSPRDRTRSRMPSSA